MATEQKKKPEDNAKRSAFAKLKTAFAAAMAIISEVEGDESGTSGEGATNATTKLADGTEIHFTGELEKGTKVYTDAEMENPVAEGTHELEDGRSIVVIADGEISEVIEAAAATDSKAKDKEIADLKAKVAELETNSVENSKMVEMMNSMTAELQKIKAFVPGGGNTGKPANQSFPDTDKNKDANKKVTALGSNAANAKTGKK